MLHGLPIFSTTSMGVMPITMRTDTFGCPPLKNSEFEMVSLVKNQTQVILFQDLPFCMVLQPPLSSRTRVFDLRFSMSTVSLSAGSSQARRQCSPSESSNLRCFQKHRRSHKASRVSGWRLKVGPHFLLSRTCTIIPGCITS
jgi:hypothetical protein